MESSFNEKIKMDDKHPKGISIKKEVSDIRRSFEGSVHNENFKYQEFRDTALSGTSVFKSSFSDDEEKMDETLKGGVTIKEFHKTVFNSTTVFSNSYDGDDEVFLDTEETSSIRITREPRPRRISDVIDSIGDISPIKDTHFTFPDFNEGTSDYSSIHKPYLMSRSPPITPGSDVGYYSTGLSTPPSILNYTMKWSRTASPIAESSRQDQMDGNKWDDTDAKPSNAQELNLDDPPPPKSSVAKMQISVAKMPVSKESDEYNMNHKYRGDAVIFNNQNFRNRSLNSRTGSNVDVKELEVTLPMLGFNVIVHEDFGYQDIQSEIAKMLEKDYSDCDCLLVVVLTHGFAKNYLHSHDHMYPLEMLWMPFASDKCPTLAGKPKIFLVQACKGEQLDAGTRLVSWSSTETDSEVTESYTIPTMADFLIAHSTVEGYYSWRNPENGSWFIQSICNTIKRDYRTTDLLKMMTRAARQVALEFASINDAHPLLHGLKQVPSIFSTLIRDIYFRPKTS